MLRAPEVKHIFAQTGMRTIVVDGTSAAVIQQAAKGSQSDIEILNFDGDVGGVRLRQLVEQSPLFSEDVARGLNDVANIFFTSGTTGVPKGAVQTHFSQFSSLRDMMVFNKWRFGREVLYCALPLTNNMACTVMMNLCMYAGGKLIIDQRWDTRRALDTIKRNSVTFTLGPPTIFIYMANEFDPEHDDLRSLKLCIVGGAPVPTEVIKRFESLSGCRLVQAYGATEVTGAVAADPIVGQRKSGSAGLPIGCSAISIVDDHGNGVPSGQLGEIRISGDTVGAGYWNDPELTAAAFTPQGWLSGDIGRLDEDGYLYIVDRKKDLIISGGFNIYPIEVENLLYSHPSVKMCAVVGVPDREKGEIAVAVIVPRDQTLTEKEILEFCRCNISAYKVPRRVAIVDALPTNPLGKVLKREIRSNLAAQDRTITTEAGRATV
jgi:acyl-CoA synthetase (AMP-forming)/AMP-acid ligase II